MSAEPEDCGSTSPTQARAALATVAELNRELEWQPSRWAVALLASCYASCVAMLTWDNFWAVALLVIMVMLYLLLRKQLVNPFVRERPWQQLESRENLSGKEWFLRQGFPLWIPFVILLPAEPRIFGLIIAVLAGIHTYCAGMNFARTTVGML